MKDGAGTLTDEEVAAIDAWAFENQYGDVAELVGEVMRLRAEVERLQAAIRSS